LDDDFDFAEIWEVICTFVPSLVGIDQAALEMKWQMVNK
jgi:hypothetical protein